MNKKVQKTLQVYIQRLQHLLVLWQTTTSNFSSTTLSTAAFTSSLTSTTQKSTTTSTTGTSTTETSPPLSNFFSQTSTTKTTSTTTPTTPAPAPAHSKHPLVPFPADKAKCSKKTSEVEQKHPRTEPTKRAWSDQVVDVEKVRVNPDIIWDIGCLRLSLGDPLVFFKAYRRVHKDCVAITNVFMTTSVFSCSLLWRFVKFSAMIVDAEQNMKSLMVSSLQGIRWDCSSLQEGQAWLRTVTAGTEGHLTAMIYKPDTPDEVLVSLAAISNFENWQYADLRCLIAFSTCIDPLKSVAERIETTWLQPSIDEVSHELMNNKMSEFRILEPTPRKKWFSVVLFEKPDKIFRRWFPRISEVKNPNACYFRNADYEWYGWLWFAEVSKSSSNCAQWSKYHIRKSHWRACAEISILERIFQCILQYFAASDRVKSGKGGKNAGKFRTEQYEAESKNDSSQS